MCSVSYSNSRKSFTTGIQWTHNFCNLFPCTVFKINLEINAVLQCYIKQVQMLKLEYIFSTFSFEFRNYSYVNRLDIPKWTLTFLWANVLFFSRLQFNSRNVYACILDTEHCTPLTVWKVDGDLPTCLTPGHASLPTIYCSWVN